MEMFEGADAEFPGGDEASLGRFWQASIRKLLSDHQWPFARRMLSTCQRSHESCRVGLQGGSPYIPRRLISIGSHPADLRLIETSERAEQRAELSTYAALSYCWGTSGKNYKTTPQNLSRNKMRLPLEKLPAVSTYHVSTRRNAETKLVLDTCRRCRCMQGFGHSVLVGRCNLYHTG